MTFELDCWCRGKEGRKVSSQQVTALRQIRHYQSSTKLLIPKAAFQRLVKEVSTSIDSSLRFQVPVPSLKCWIK